MGIKKGALVIPQRAVTEVQGRYLVAVVGPENKVSIKPVKVGQRFGPLWVVEEGLVPGEKVVAEGTQKIREGMVVSPKPFRLLVLERGRHLVEGSFQLPQLALGVPVAGSGRNCYHFGSWKVPCNQSF
jgi:hypothetical protein